MRLPLLIVGVPLGIAAATFTVSNLEPVEIEVGLLPVTLVASKATIGLAALLLGILVGALFVWLQYIGTGHQVRVRQRRIETLEAENAQLRQRLAAYEKAERAGEKSRSGLPALQDKSTLGPTKLPALKGGLAVQGTGVAASTTAAR